MFGSRHLMKGLWLCEYGVVVQFVDGYSVDAL